MRSEIWYVKSEICDLKFQISDVRFEAARRRLVGFGDASAGLRYLAAAGGTP
jgi:hypothetical protein